MWGLSGRCVSDGRTWTPLVSLALTLLPALSPHTNNPTVPFLVVFVTSQFFGSVWFLLVLLGSFWFFLVPFFVWFFLDPTRFQPLNMRKLDNVTGPTRVENPVQLKNYLLKILVLVCKNKVGILSKKGCTNQSIFVTSKETAFGSLCQI